MHKSIKFLMLAIALWCVGIAPALAAFDVAKDRELRYRYKNKSYIHTENKLCGSKEAAIKLMKQAEREIRAVKTADDWEEFNNRYDDRDRLKRNHPDCDIFPITISTIIEIIPTTGVLSGILYLSVYDEEKKLSLNWYNVHPKRVYDFRLYDSLDQLISLIESGEITWEFLSDAEKQAVWDSFFGDSEEEKFTKRLHDVLDAQKIEQGAR